MERGKGRESVWGGDVGRDAKGGGGGDQFGVCVWGGGCREREG